MVNFDHILTTVTKNSWSNFGQNLVNRPTFDNALFGEDLAKVLVNYSCYNVGPDVNAFSHKVDEENILTIS